MNQYQSYLFDFSCSFLGGGLKRILAYLDWFNNNGGACFVLNNHIQGIEKKFPHNRYCFLRKNSLDKVLNYSFKLNKYISEIGKIDFYYSYNIPLIGKPGKINWIHIGNVLPFLNPRKYISFKRSLELQLLGLLIKKSLKHADIISAESQASLDLLTRYHNSKLIVSVNGSDEEINTYHNLQSNNQIENIAVSVGTCQYKSIDDVYTIYLHLRKTNPDLILVIVGIKEDVPTYIKKDTQVILRGMITHLQVCELLSKAKHYITATLVENSYNAASEGAFLAKEAFISDIGPHRELLKNMNYQRINNLGTRLDSLYVKHEDLNINNLQTWDQIITGMIQVAQSCAN